MSDLIKREDAIKATWKEPTYADPINILTEVRDRIEAIPSADRPQGEWIDRSDGGRILHPWWESCECSQCEEWGSGAWNFCPHCGAKMKGADDE